MRADSAMREFSDEKRRNVVVKRGDGPFDGRLRLVVAFDDLGPFALAEDRAGQHHALLMALTMFDRARWTNKSPLVRPAAMITGTGDGDLDHKLEGCRRRNNKERTKQSLSSAN